MKRIPAAMRYGMIAGLCALTAQATLAAGPGEKPTAAPDAAPSLESIRGVLVTSDADFWKSKKIAFRCQVKQLEGSTPYFLELSAANGTKPPDVKTLMPAGSITSQFECTYEGDGTRYHYVVKDVPTGGVVECHSNGTTRWKYHPQENVCFRCKGEQTLQPLPITAYLDRYAEAYGGVSYVSSPVSLYRLLADTAPADVALQKSGEAWSVAVKTRIERGPYAGWDRYRDFLLDPQRGWQPLKYAVGVSMDDRKLPPSLEITYSDYLQVGEQHVPGKITAIVFGSTPKDRRAVRMSKDTELLHYRLEEVTIEITGVTAASSNRGEQGAFDFQIPPGTNVVDQEKDGAVVWRSDLKGPQKKTGEMPGSGGIRKGL